MAQLLVVSPDLSERTQLVRMLAKHTPVGVGSGAEALLAVQGTGVSGVVCTYALPGLEGAELVRMLLDRHPGLPIVVVTDAANVSPTLALVQAGAAGWIQRPLDSRAVLAVVDSALERAELRQGLAAMQARLGPKPASDRVKLIGESAPMARLRELIRRVGPTDLGVLITGESGTGKEVVARALHATGDRAGRPFVPVDCAAIPANLMESELFGHERGAFTGASGRRTGLVEAANGGTFFMDEIGELDLTTQVKLLRLIQERTYRRVGGNKLLSAELRMVAATNRELEPMIAAGGFREDLFHRLNVVRLHLPPLRDRRDDVPLLLRHFLDLFAAEAGRVPLEIPPSVQEVLSAHSWPGNVRELVNCARYVSSLAPGPQLRVEDLPPRVRGQLRMARRPSAPAPQVTTAGVRYDLPYKQAKTAWLEVFEVAYLAQLLAQHDGNVSQAAATAGIDRKSIQRLMKRHGLRRE